MRACATLMLVGLASVLAASTPAHAAMVPAWEQGTYRYAAVDLEVGEVLRDFARNLKVGIDLAEGVTGTVSLPMTEMSPRRFLDAVTARSNLLWYFDGVTLHVVPASASETRLLDLKDIAVSELVGRMTALDLYDARYPVRTTPDGRFAVVAGPKVYVDLVESTLRGMGAAPMPRVFRGRDPVTARAEG